MAAPARTPRRRSSPEDWDSGRIGALAVDVEPTVFWDGKVPSPDELLAKWRAAVGFEDVRHGSVTPGHNGPSGAGLEAEFLEPLELDVADVAFTDAVPWFFVKHGTGSQGEAMTKKYDAVAAQLGLPEATLPERPSIAELVAIAGSDERRDGLRAEVVRSGASFVISLGDEALRALAAVADNGEELPSALDKDTYGREVELVVDGRSLTLLPSIHPGLLRQQKKGSGWRLAFEAWQERVRRERG